MWLVRLALLRPYTFIVMSMLIVIAGVVSIWRMPTDIFPAIDIPVISVVWNYGGLSPEEMERRIVNNYERTLTTTVNDIEHIESQSLTGMSIIKIYLQPGARVEAAIAEVTAISQTVLRSMPTGTLPPLVIRYSASNVPIIQLALGGKNLSEQQLFDFGTNSLRPGLVTIPGAQLPWPYGGKQRQIMVDIDPRRLYARGLSPRDVQAAIGTQNLVLPTGSAKMGNIEYPISVNSSPTLLQQIGDLPVKVVDATPIYVRDVASVRDGYSPQTSMVHVEGKRSVLMTILKNGSASTLDVVDSVREMLPKILARLPKELTVSALFDQSLFVRAAVDGVLHEALIAAGLTALMILLFLGSWRSTLIVVISIPLSILVSIVVLHALGHTLNVMTLGGLALAVGILVDDATVEVENIHRNMAHQPTMVRAIMTGAQEIAAPAFVATLCICIVFVPVAFITGSAKSLFVPLALAVVFAMLTSYGLSRTLVPTLARLLLQKHQHEHDAQGTSRWARFVAAFDRGFDRLRTRYGSALAWSLHHRPISVVAFTLLVMASLSLFPLLGRDFFPSVDAGLIKLHVRGSPGTRIEETERRIAAIEQAIRTVIPAQQIETLLDNIGMPVSGINLSLSEGALISSADAQISVALKKDHAPTEGYVNKLRTELKRRFPEQTFFFLAPDISTQVLNFGLAAPIDIQVSGNNAKQNHQVALNIAAKLRRVPGAADVHLAQVPATPQVRMEIDRTKAGQVGLTQRDVASDLLVSLSSSGTVAPSYWVDPVRGVQYLVAVQTPQYQNDSIAALVSTPVSTPASAASGANAGPDGPRPQLLGNLASVSRTSGPVNVTHYNIAGCFDVQANVAGTDLGSVAAAVDGIIAEVSRDLPRGTSVTLKGQAESMRSSFRGLSYGLIFAVLLVYLLMVVNFQSWLDPLVILMALPGALSGIMWMLFLSQTTVSVPALMGSIMCVGVATANSILVVTFANEQRAFGRDSVSAALAAGMTRLRPVIMTALAMIIGMFPMSLGLGEGGEQNAPLGRAVIGGLTLATFSTLFFVPVMYSLLRKKVPQHDPELDYLL
jgi:multidrug efflux pump subunit AcrB